MPGQIENHKTITTDFIMDGAAKYEVDIAGRRFPVKPYSHPLPATTLKEQFKRYTPTPIQMYKI